MDFSRKYVQVVIVKLSVEATLPLLYGNESKIIAESGVRTQKIKH